MSAANPLTWTLRSIARIERPGGLRKARLTESDHVKWHRMRRRLDWIDFIELLHEDLATTFPWPFDLARWDVSPLAALTPRTAEELVGTAASPDESDALAFLRAAARALGLPAGGSITDLPRVAPHQKVLELASGRVAFQQVQTHGDLAFHEQFTFVADSDAERLLIGLASVELRSNPPRILRPAELRQQHAAGQRFDRVLGIKGLAWAEALADELKLEVRWT
jgi:hypothetical protein